MKYQKVFINTNKSADEGPQRQLFKLLFTIFSEICNFMETAIGRF